jgi:hypothetical protein
MKKHLLVTFFLLSIVSLTNAQIPGAGFESWTDGNPNGWYTSNITSFITNVTQSSEFHSGSSAAKLVVGSFVGQYPAILWSGSNQTGISGFPVSQRYGSLRGYYKLTSSANKVLEILIYFDKAGSTIGVGAISLAGNVPNYTEFIVPVDYGGSTAIPDTALIYISYLDTADVWTVGGGAFIDDLSLGGFVDVKEITNNQTPTSYELMQNYPNPFNPSTKIEYSIPEESFVELKIYNLIGQEVATLVNQNQNAGTYRADFNAEGMQSGIYIAKLNANGFTRSVKMTLLK